MSGEDGARRLPLDADGDVMVELRGDLGVDTVAVDSRIGSGTGSLTTSYDADQLWDFLDDFGTDYVAIVVSWSLHFEYTSDGDYFQFRWTKGNATFDNDPARSNGEFNIYPEQSSPRYYQIYNKLTGQIGGNGNGETFGPFRPTWPNWYFETFDDDDDIGFLYQHDSADSTSQESFRWAAEFVIGEIVD